MTTFGVEIETIIYPKGTINVGDYHEGQKFTKYWNCERDSSIFTNEDNESSNEYDYSDNSEDALCCEFVSIKLNGIMGLKNALKDWETNLKKLTGTDKLNKAIFFNSSCGCHVHIREVSSKAFFKKMPIDNYLKVRKRFFKLIKASNIDSKEDILEHYFRGYAKEVLKPNSKYKDKYADNRNYSLFYESGDRGQEFNINSERNLRGLEWRSLNMKDIDTWEEFNEYWDIVIDCLKYLIKLKEKYTINDTLNLSTKVDKSLNKGVYEKIDNLEINQLETLKVFKGVNNVKLKHNKITDRECNLNLNLKDFHKWKNKEENETTLTLSDVERLRNMRQHNNSDYVTMNSVSEQDFMEQRRLRDEELLNELNEGEE